MSGLEELLAEAAAWCEAASWGDGGERPAFDLFWDGRKGMWTSTASSFYDGGGRFSAAVPAEAVAGCLAEIRNHPQRERAAARESAVYALSRYLRITHVEAERRIARIEEPG